LGDQWDEVDRLIDELIEAEDVHATGSGEQAETEIEAAKLDAIRTHCMAMSGAIGAILSASYPAIEPARYAEELKALVGKRNNATDQAMIQTVHDHAQALGATCDYANARFAAQKDCEKCDGTGQIKDGDTQMDCPACEGAGTYKAAAATDSADQLRAACSCATEGGMTKAERIAALLKNEHNPIKDIKALEANTDEGLRLLEVHCENAATLKTAADKLAEEKAAADKKAADAEAALKVAQAAQIPAEELTELRTLAADKKAADATEHAGLVTQLKAAQTAFTEDELKSKPLPELRKLASMAKVEPKDYSGRGIAMPRAAASAGDFTPPNVYPSLAKKAN